MPRTVSELQYVRLYPKGHALIFLHHPNTVPKKLQARSLKPYYPTAQRNNYDSTYRLVQNVHFIAEVIKQVPKWPSFFSTITGALGYCQINTESLPNSMAYTAGKVRGTILIQDGRKRILRTGAGKVSWQRQMPLRLSRKWCVWMRKNSCLWDIMQLFSTCTYGKPKYGLSDWTGKAGLW